MPSVEVRGLTKRFGEFTAVDNVSLAIRGGEYISIIGPSGCGKTTLLRMIAGILAQDEGSIRFDGELVDSKPVEERGVGYVFQDIALFPHMSLWDNVCYGPRARGTPRERTRAVALEMLEMMKLTERHRDFPSELSGGMQQKAAVARAIAPGYKLMLLDEPLSMLDAKVRSQLRFELRAIVKDLGLTAVHVTHDQEEAMAISDRIFVMRKGSLVEHGTPAELYFRPKRLFTAHFLGESNVLPGKVLRSRRSGSEVGVGHLQLRSSQVDIEEGARVAVAIRPELIGIDHEEGVNRMRGEIESRSFEGPFVRYVLEISDDLFLRVKEPVQLGRSPRKKGDHLTLCVKPEHVRVYEFPSGGLNTEIGW